VADEVVRREAGRVQAASDGFAAFAHGRLVPVPWSIDEANNHWI
jgi:hypothetical protein